MGIFKGIKPQENTEYTLREPGTYEFALAEVQAGLLNSKFTEEPKPTLRFVFEDEEGKISALISIPSLVRLASGEYGLAWNEKGKFWVVVGALWGRSIGPDEATLLDMEIPGVSDHSDLVRLPLLFTEGQKPVTGVVIHMGEENVTTPGRKLLLTVSKKQNNDREVNVVTGYAAVPKKKAAKPAATPW